MICAYSPVRTYFDGTFAPVRLARKSKGHRVQMGLTVDRFEDFHSTLPRQSRLSDLGEFRQEHLDGFKAWRSIEGEPQFVKPATLNKDLRNLRTLLNFARKRGHLTAQLFFEFENEDLDPPIAWWPEELQRFFASCELEIGMIGKIPRSLFWRALGATIYSTGARIGAVMQIRRDLFDSARGSVCLKAATQKQKRGQWVPLHSETAAAIVATLAFDPDREILLPWPYDKNQPGWPTLTAHLKRILGRAGLPFDSKHLFHCLRKTTATWITQSGGKEAAREQLDHSTQRVTDRYCDPRQLTRSNAKNLIPPPPLTAQPTVAPPVDPQRMLFDC